VFGEGQSTARPREVVVELSSTHLGGLNEEQHLQAEYDTEERILSDATSTAVANYSAQATAIVSESAAGIVETLSSLMIRFGSFTGLFAGSGGIALAAYLHPPSVMLGVFGVAETSESMRGTNQRSDASSNRYGVLYGLFATSAFGFASAGVSYLVRNRVRAAIAGNRETRDNRAIGCPEKCYTDASNKES
jgi:hypothetical protein